ncbi:peptidyl-tRNA hydrolase, PTH2 family [Trypanosoma grayi]|uniref:peptidyl-tRNA hydrolase, PTH2 family n=1 Tax=Trypanosoma grayi TaxID=71804 RepID=UPI0004F49413|nr:peptidyl-tRNA hydrolase, PTH2 family [Trypanosoma grayi]KEG15625.1 peptidyl-tRNA hydrolase, PTH2 family [Trypanosoma grayi]
MQAGGGTKAPGDAVHNLLVNLLGFVLGVVVSVTAEWLLRWMKPTPAKRSRPSRAQRAVQALEELRERKRQTASLQEQELEGQQQQHRQHQSDAGEEEEDGAGSEDEEEWSTEEDEECDDSDEDSELERMEELRLKMVFVIRRDLKKMPAHDIAALTAGAAVDVVHKIQYGADNTQWLEWYWWWNRVGCAKIALKCPDGETLQRVVAESEAAGLPFSVVGESGEHTLVAIGPVPSGVLDPITGSLKLLS